VLQFLAVGAWAFFLLSLGSFSVRDWPSHDVFPHPPTQNLCGSAGAWVAYHSYFWVGQGVFPVLLFSGLAVALYLFRRGVDDLWMRSIGLLLLSVAFAAAVHHFRPGSQTGFPEGNGGLLGIGTATFLQSHFSTAGTRLILLTTALVGLLLAADDLLARTPGYVAAAHATVRETAPRFAERFNFPALPTLPSLPKFRTAGASAGSDVEQLGNGDEIPLAPKKPRLGFPKIFSRSNLSDATGDAGPSTGDRGRTARTRIPPKATADDADEIELTYADDAPAAGDAAYVDDDEPGPSAPVTIPPPAPVLAVRDAQTTAIVPFNNPESAASTDPTFVVDESGDATPAAPAPAVIRPDIKVKLPSMLKPRNVSPPPPPKELGEYTFPSWEVLEEAEHGYAESQEQFVREMAAILEQALKEFEIDAHVVEIDTGPVITMYELALAPGVKVSAISALGNDIQRALKAETVRIVAPIPGKSTVGIEVPNAQKEKVRFKELMQLAPEVTSAKAIPMFLGKDASGEPLIVDLASMPHCLIAGTTGSGKSVCINTIIMSIMYTQRPDMVKLILFDPKVVEMAMYKDIPHLMCPVINDAAKATSVLDWACQKMDERYEFLAEAGVRNIKGYNQLTRDELVERFKPGNDEEEAKIPKKLPYIVIIIDELADLMMTSGKEVEAHIVRLAQKARAVGIHLILATQRPSANVVTGLIKSNMPTRIAFRVQSKMDSRIVLDQNGADLLLGQGDMLYLPPGASKPVRSQGTFIDDKEIRESVKLVKASAEAQYEPDLVQIKATGDINEEAAKDELFDDAVRVVLETKRGSVSLLQRRLTIGYARASRLIEAMAQAGILGDYKGSQAREVNITVEEWDAMRGAQQEDAESGMSV